MTITVNYQKRKNNSLFNKFLTNKNINLSDVQNYIPIYEKFLKQNKHSKKKPVWKKSPCF